MNTPELLACPKNVGPVGEGSDEAIKIAQLVVVGK